MPGTRAADPEPAPPCGAAASAGRAPRRSRTAAAQAGGPEPAGRRGVWPEPASGSDPAGPDPQPGSDPNGPGGSRGVGAAAAPTAAAQPKGSARPSQTGSPLHPGHSRTDQS